MSKVVLVIDLPENEEDKALERKMLMYKNKYIDAKSKNARGAYILNSYAKNCRRNGNFLVHKFPNMAKHLFDDADYLEKTASEVSEVSTGSYVNDPMVLVEKLNRIEAQVDKIRNAGHSMIEHVYVKMLLDMFDPESGKIKELKDL